MAKKPTTNPSTSEHIGEDAASTSEIGWAAAMEEIESIVASLEDDSADVDTLSARIERASVLIAACRRRLRTTQLRVYELIEQLDDDPEDGATEE